MREEQRVKRFIRLNLRNKLVSMQKERRLGKKKLGNDGRSNGNGKKSRESGTKRGAPNNALSMNNAKRKDKSDMSVEEERILAIGIEAITSLEATIAMKVPVCQHRGIEIMIDEQHPELARPKLSLPRQRLLQLMIRAWKKRHYSCSSRKARN
jgi:hypothetical protein